MYELYSCRLDAGHSQRIKEIENGKLKALHLFGALCPQRTHKGRHWFLSAFAFYYIVRLFLLLLISLSFVYFFKFFSFAGELLKFNWSQNKMKLADTKWIKWENGVCLVPLSIAKKWSTFACTADPTPYGNEPSNWITIFESRMDRIATQFGKYFRYDFCSLMQTIAYHSPIKTTWAIADNSHRFALLANRTDAWHCLRLVHCLLSTIK